MSMICCDSCDRMFDSDEDPDCFIVWDAPYDEEEAVICERCRERALVSEP
jgi:hypothetical protein